jgi:hypothetical protein
MSLARSCNHPESVAPFGTSVGNTHFSAGPDKPPPPWCFLFNPPSLGPWCRCRPREMPSPRSCLVGAYLIPILGIVKAPPRINLCRLRCGVSVSIVIDNDSPAAVASRQLADRPRMCSSTSRYPLFRAIANFYGNSVIHPPDPLSEDSINNGTSWCLRQINFSSPRQLQLHLSSPSSTMNRTTREFFEPGVLSSWLAASLSVV